MLLLPFLLTLSVLAPVQATSGPEVKGVHSSLYPKYSPTSSGRWSCLDGSHSIPWSALNDDYCDCPDGSDEPGMTLLSRPIRPHNPLVQFRHRRVSELYLFLSQCRPRRSFHLRNESERRSMRSVYSFPFPRSVLTHYQSPNVATDPMNPPAYAPTPVTRLVSVIEHSWNKRPNYVRPYVSLPSFPRNPLTSSHIQGSKLRASYISFAQKEKNRLETLVTSTKREVTAHANELVRIKGIYSPSRVSNLSHPIPSRDRRSNRIRLRRCPGEEKIIS